VGLAIKPATSAESVVKYADFVDTLLIMTVEPGFGGQKFMHDMMPKVCAYIMFVVSVYMRQMYITCAMEMLIFIWYTFSLAQLKSK